MERTLKEAVAEISDLRDDPAGLADAADRATHLARLIRMEAERRRETWPASPAHAKPSPPPARDDHATARRA